MKRWQTWTEKAGSSLIDIGAPLGKGAQGAAPRMIP